MSDNEGLRLTQEAIIPALFSKGSVLTSFAMAVARTHPAPAALLAAFREEMSRREEGDLPFHEMSPANQLASQHYDLWRDELIDALVKRSAET